MKARTKKVARAISGPSSEAMNCGEINKNSGLRNSSEAKQSAAEPTIHRSINVNFLLCPVPLSKYQKLSTFRLSISLLIICNIAQLP